jgi:hypothetical protein
MAERAPDCDIEFPKSPGCPAKLYFGLRNQLTYDLGEKYRWTNSPLVKNGGRPPEGTLDGEGYTECPICQKDFFVIVRVQNGILRVLNQTWRRTR